MECPVCECDIVYHYRLVDSKGDPYITSVENAIYATYPPDVKDKFSSFTNTNLYTKCWERTDDIITFSGVRIPHSAEDVRPPIEGIYTETIDITSNIKKPFESSFITAKKNYRDNGTGFETKLPFVDYVVLGANGIYKGRTNIRIYIDNVNKIRKVVIS